MNSVRRLFQNKKIGKAAGVDNIPGELLKAVGNRGKHALCNICEDIHENIELPNEFTESIIIPIEKKNGAQECFKFRITSLVTRASKIMLKIIARRLKSRCISR